MEEELEKILTNEELDAKGRTEAIKTLVGKDYIPLNKHTEKINKVQDEVKNLQAEYDTFKKSKMTEEEQKEEALKVEREKAQKNTRLLSELYAKNVFAEAGIGKEEYEEIIPAIIQGDPEATKNLAQKICSSMLKQKESIENKFKEDLIKGQKKPEGGNSQGGEPQTDLEALQEAYQNATNAVEQASILRKINALNNKK